MKKNVTFVTEIILFATNVTFMYIVFTCLKRHGFNFTSYLIFVEIFSNIRNFVIIYCNNSYIYFCIC